ncbi:MAG: hypothetical protein WCJ35_17655 [Planctomycetota bacterium]
MFKPTKKPAADKPAKFYSDFPPFPHTTQRWVRKICGKLPFGRWDSWKMLSKKILNPVRCDRT